MIHVELSGTPYEMGFQHGKALRPLVDAFVKYDLRRHSYKKPVSLDLDDMLNRINNYAPSLIEEIRGIADGADIPFDIMVELNIRINYFCTCIAFTTSENGPVLGKNLDFYAYAFQVLFTVKPETGYEMLTVGAAGSPASYGGLNRAGLAMGHAAIVLTDARDKGNLPVTLLRRQALQYCATVPEAIAYLSEHDPWQIGDNIMFLDRQGDAAVVEMRPGVQNIHRPKNDRIWCTGCSPQMEPNMFTEDHLKRYRHIEQTLQSKETLTSDYLCDLLSSHEGETPICRDSTQLSFLAYPASGTLKVADGFPCQTGYTKTLQFDP